MFLIILYVVCLVARQFLQPKMIADSMGLDSMATLVLIYTGSCMNIGIVELIVKMIAMQSYKSEESYGDSRNRKL